MAKGKEAGRGNPGREDSAREVEELRARLEECMETLSAIRAGEVDAVVVSMPEGEKVFTLKGAEHPYRVIVETMNEGAVTTTLDGVILYTNKRFLEMVGGDGSVMAVQFQEFIDEGERGEFEKFLAAAGRGPAAADGPAVGRWTLLGAGGTTLKVNISTNVIAEGDLRSICMVVTDLSDIERANEERRRLELEVLGASDGERQRIGQDLHDTLGQTVAAMIISSKLLAQDLGGAKREASGEAAANAAYADRIAEMAREAAQQLRQLSRGLYPKEIEEGRLAEALRKLAARTTEMFGIKCAFEARGEIDLGDLVVRRHAFLIAAEAVNNAVKHSGGSEVRITLTKEDGTALLEVADNGSGLKQAAGSEGLGMRTMKYRAELIGATLEISNQLGGGMTVRCRLPVKK